MLELLHGISLEQYKVDGQSRADIFALSQLVESSWGE